MAEQGQMSPTYHWAKEARHKKQMQSLGPFKWSSKSNKKIIIAFVRMQALVVKSTSKITEGNYQKSQESGYC